MTAKKTGSPGKMASVLLPLAAGTLFGAGLALGAMIDPKRVLGFLDPLGSWDPTLAFVMAGATAVMALAWLIQPRIRRPLLDERFFVPGRRDVDARLIAGSALFGIGWGLAGICPGPAVALVALDPAIVVFIVAMLAGMMVHRLVEAPLRSRR